VKVDTERNDNMRMSFLVKVHQPLYMLGLPLEKR